MFVVQKKENDASQWHTCNYNGKKCRYTDIAKARTAFRRQKESADGRRHPDRQYRILDSLTDKEVG